MKIIGRNIEKRDLMHIVPRLIIVLIIAQTLPFKYMGAKESTWIFIQMGWEPWGRYLIAVTETIAILFLLSPWYVIGAIITLSVISAANFMHFTRLGIEVNGDGGTLFILSVTVIICSLIILVYWNKIKTQKEATHLDFDDFSEEENLK